jgi:hypothetical protein
MATKRKWRWVTQDHDAPNHVDIWPETPEPTNEIGHWEQNNYSSLTVCKKEFETLTGIKIGHQKPSKVEFTTRLIE